MLTGWVVATLPMLEMRACRVTVTVLVGEWGTGPICPTSTAKRSTVGEMDAV